MKKALTKFLIGTLILSSFLLVVSLVYVGKSKEDLDPDSMMMALLLLAFSGISTLIIIAILSKLRGNNRS